MVCPLYGHTMNRAWFPVGSYASFADVSHLYTPRKFWRISWLSMPTRFWPRSRRHTIRGYRRGPAIMSNRGAVRTTFRTALAAVTSTWTVISLKYTLRLDSDIILRIADDLEFAAGLAAAALLSLPGWIRYKRGLQGAVRLEQ